MIWTALVPLKAEGERKSRLAAQLSSAERDDLTYRMLERVRAALVEVPNIARLVLLAPQRPACWLDDLITDEGRGLNVEIEAARGALAHGPLLVVHADLPLLAAEDVCDLLALAEREGVAIAPDRHDLGTNALAIADDRPWTFAFGPDSRARYAEAGAVTLNRESLAFDLDTGEDLERLLVRHPDLLRSN